MRIFKTFTLTHLETSAEVSTANLQKYIKALHRAGYLRQVRPKRNGELGGHAIWKLIARSPGPRAPIVRNDQAGVYDPNSDLFIPWREEEPAHDPTSEAGPLDHEETADDRRKLA